MAQAVQTANRSRTVTWEDPALALQKIVGLTGLEAMQAVIRGDVSASPFVDLLGIRAVEAEGGKVVLAVRPGEYHLNPTGTAHGGLAATLLDSAMWSAVQTTMPVNGFGATLQMNVNYLRPITMSGGEVRAEGQVLHRGRRTAAASGSVFDGDGRLCAHGTITCAVFGGE